MPEQVISYHYLANICFLSRNCLLNIKEKALRNFYASWVFCNPSLWKEQRLTVTLRKQVFLLIRYQAPNSEAVYADSTELPTKFHFLSTQWSVRVWSYVLQSCPLCSQQDSWRLSKASGSVGAVGSCLLAVFKLPRSCCTHGAWSMLLIWSLHIYRCMCTVSSIYLCLCAVLSLAASSILLNAFTPGNNAWSSGKVACLYAAQSLFPYNSLVVSHVST